MSILVYSANQYSDGKRLLKSISFTRISLCRFIDQLQYCLNTPDWLRKIMLLIINDPAEIIRISRLAELHLELLTILEQHVFETNKNVHRLRPRYITSKDGDFRYMATVLNKAMNRLN